MNFITSKLTKALTALTAIVPLLFSAISVSNATIDTNIALQNEHMDYLVNEYYAEYTPCDESTIAGFDINDAIADGVKYNEVSFVGTHNSYQTASTAEYSELYSALSDLTFGIIDSSLTDFNMESLTNQLQSGIRSLELDIETVVNNGEISFVVSHSPNIDITSNCYDFEKAIQEVKMWSDANPNHLPITIIIEPKKGIVPINGMKNFNLNYANELDSLLHEVLGESLLTPADMMGDYESFKAMREADGWLTLEETMGKVLVLLHDTTVTDKYIKQDTSIKTQAMFPMLRYSDRNEEYASFIIENSPSDALKHSEETIDNCKLIARTRADSYTSYSDTKYEKAIKSGAQIISTDHPVRSYTTDEHTFTFDNGYTVVCNK